PQWGRKEAAAVLRGFLDKGSAPPMSFTYGGRSSRELLPAWKVTRNSTDESDRRLHTVKYADPASSLELVVEIREYKDFPAVEWVQYFKNAGTVDTPIVEDVRALDVTLDVEPGGEVVLHRALGCTSTVSDFAPVDDILTPGYKNRITPIGGRSSNGAMPFFNLEIPGNRGVMVAIGWTGQWAAEFERPYLGPYHNGGKVIVRTGMAHTHLKLHPGEQIRTPQTLLLFWEGDRIAGHNQFRRFVLRHKTPQLGGKPVELPVAACAWFQFDYGNRYTEENQIAFAQLYKKLGLDTDTFWMDAGWFDGGFPSGAGNWFPKKEAFPNGFKKISEAVHGMGMKFLLWFEPERVSEGSWLHREHPEWLLSHAEGAMVFLSPDQNGRRSYLLNLGNPAARAWLTDHVSQMIKEAKIDIYRHDANIDPLDFWPLVDPPDRQGITEIRHVEGLYSYWEDLKSRHPGLLIECCCSGNRRFDLETISRTINLWRSDYIFNPSADQCQTYGISFFIQLHANGCNTVDKYGFRSILAPGMCLCWDPRKPDFPLEQARENIALFKRVRPYFSGDYYPLTPYSTKENVWLAYQFHRGDLDEGVVLAFRRASCPSSALVVQMGGVLQDVKYEVENVDTGKKEQHKGAELASGLRVTAESRPAAAVLIYRRLK
ncbi:MAG: alpha-galactosidase, partial [Planctomycetes bacterium]|nr:alpha-galactosidase [Planctomycetota bacterium]